jgi:hypothetical protein
MLSAKHSTEIGACRDPRQPLIACGFPPLPTEDRGAGGCNAATRGDRQIIATHDSWGADLGA